MSPESLSTSFISQKKTEKVFDTSLYKDTPPKKRVRVIANELAGMVLEAGDRSLTERINPWYIAITAEGKVINLVSRQEVTVNFGDKTELARSETRGANEFYYQKAKDAKEGDVIFGLSPSGGNSPYKESRINVAKVRVLCGVKVLECYGIPSKLSPDQILSIANYLKLMLEEPSIKTPDQLRELAIHWPSLKGEDVWQQFSAALQLDSNAWQAIASRSPRRVKRQAYKVALPEAQRLNRDLENAHSEEEFIELGARAELYMISNGYELDTSGCPGAFNSDLVRPKMVKDVYGNYRITTVEPESQYERVIECTHCPACKKTVRAGIKNGHIHCLSCGAVAPCNQTVSV